MIHTDTYQKSVEKRRAEKKTKKDDVIRTNTLLERALFYLDHPTENEQLRSIDMTPVFLEEFKIMIKNKEYINININGLPASGKSTAGIALMIYGMHILKKPITLWNISRDQTEYGRRIRQHNEQTDTFMLIDEWNELETTGYNATKRQAYLETESDLLAQRNIRKIGCSPKNQVDKNAFIFLEVLQQDKHKRLSRCLLYYKAFVAGNEYQQLLGHVDIDVTAALNHPIYADYRRRKFERMDLLIKEGVDSPERLYQSIIVLQLCKELRKIARQGIVNRGIIKVALDEAVTKHKELYSILGREDLVDTIKGIMEAEKDHAALLKKINVLKTKMNDGGASQHLMDAITDLTEAEQLLIKRIANTYLEQERLIGILKRYEALGTTTTTEKATP